MSQLWSIFLIFACGYACTQLVGLCNSVYVTKFCFVLPSGMCFIYNCLTATALGQHFCYNSEWQLIIKLPQIENIMPWWRCAFWWVCDKQKGTLYWCRRLDGELCSDCFKDYHIKLNYTYNNNHTIILYMNCRTILYNLKNIWL